LSDPPGSTVGEVRDLAATDLRLAPVGRAPGHVPVGADGGAARPVVPVPVSGTETDGIRRGRAAWSSRSTSAPPRQRRTGP